MSVGPPGSAADHTAATTSPTAARETLALARPETPSVVVSVSAEPHPQASSPSKSAVRVGRVHSRPLDRLARRRPKSLTPIANHLGARGYRCCMETPAPDETRRPPAATAGDQILGFTREEVGSRG